MVAEVFMSFVRSLHSQVIKATVTSVHKLWNLLVYADLSHVSIHLYVVYMGKVFLADIDPRYVWYSNWNNQNPMLFRFLTTESEEMQTKITIPRAAPTP